MTSLGLLIVRAVIGALFVGHGTQKLFGWFGGHGVDGTAGFMESLRYRDGRTAAVLAGLTETVSGALLAIGFLTPLAVAGIIGVMVSAMVTVHWRKGLWNVNGGIELPLVYAVIVSALAVTGPGQISLDAVLGLGLRGIAFGIGAVVVGVIAAVVALSMRRPEQVEEATVQRERVAA